MALAPAQLGTQPLDPQATPARVDRDAQFVEALRLRASPLKADATPLRLRL